LLKLLNIQHHISKGSYLRYTRKKQGLTQEKVCEGICSVTYLSKIETGKVIPNEEIFVLLCDRLNISPSELEKFPTDELEELFEQIYEAIECRQLDRAKNLMERLSTYLSFIELEPNLYIFYQLIMYYYYMHAGKLSKAKEYKTELSKIQNQMSEKQQLMFTYFNGIYLGINRQYEKALTLFKKVEKLLDSEGKKNANLYFHLALSYSYLQNSVMAVYYANAALKLFNESSNYLKSLDCKMIMGINYARSKNFRTAEKEYLQILEMAKQFNLDEMKARVYHNLGFMYIQQKNYKLSEAMLFKSLKYRTEFNGTKLTTILYLIDLFIETEQFEKALSEINKVKSNPLLDEWQKEIQYRELKISCYMNPSDKSLIVNYYHFCEHVYLPYIKKINDTKKLHDLLKELGDYYYSQRKYKVSSDYYRMIHETLSAH
jgi:HTH-type transcriptional regulator, quorum sensing regulator NprR